MTIIVYKICTVKGSIRHFTARFTSDSFQALSLYGRFFIMWSWNILKPSAMSNTKDIYVLGIWSHIIIKQCRERALKKFSIWKSKLAVKCLICNHKWDLKKHKLKYYRFFILPKSACGIFIKILIRKYKFSYKYIVLYLILLKLVPKSYLGLIQTLRNSFRVYGTPSLPQ